MLWPCDIPRKRARGTPTASRPMIHRPWHENRKPKWLRAPPILLFIVDEPHEPNTHERNRAQPSLTYNQRWPIILRRQCAFAEAFQLSSHLALGADHTNESIGEGWPGRTGTPFRVPATTQPSPFDLKPTLVHHPARLPGRSSTHMTGVGYSFAPTKASVKGGRDGAVTHFSRPGHPSERGAKSAQRGSWAVARVNETEAQRALGALPLFESITTFNRRTT